METSGKDGQPGVGKANSMSAQYSLLATTNDSRLRIYDLDNFAMVGVSLVFFCVLFDVVGVRCLPCPSVRPSVRPSACLSVFLCRG